MIYVLNPKVVAKHKYGKGVRSSIISVSLNLFKPRKIEESKWTREIVSLDIDALSKFWNVVKHKTPIMVARTPRYLQWRYFDCPNIKYSMFVAEKDELLAGFMVVRFRREKDFTRCTLIDFLSTEMNSLDEHEVMRDLIRHCLNYAAESGADIVDGWIPHQYANDFKSVGFRSRGTNLGWVVYSSVPQRSVYTNRANYYLTMGDSDGG